MIGNNICSFQELLSANVKERRVNDDDIKMFTSTCILYTLYTALSRESVCSREEVTVTLRQRSQQEEGGREQIAPPYLISGWVNALRNPRAKIVLNG